MVDNADVMSRPRHPRRRCGLPAVAVVALDVLALATCRSGSPTPSRPAAPRRQQLPNAGGRAGLPASAPHWWVAATTNPTVLARPTVGANGRPVFDLSSADIEPQSTESSQFQSKEVARRSLTGGSVPILPVT